MNPFSAMLALANNKGELLGSPSCSLSIPRVCLKFPGKDQHEIVPVTASARNTNAPDVQLLLNTRWDVFRTVMVPMRSNAQPALDPIAYMSAG